MKKNIKIALGCLFGIGGLCMLVGLVAKIKMGLSSSSQPSESTSESGSQSSNDVASSSDAGDSSSNTDTFISSSTDTTKAWLYSEHHSYEDVEGINGAQIGTDATAIYFFNFSVSTWDDTYDRFGQNVVSEVTSGDLTRVEWGVFGDSSKAVIEGSKITVPAFTEYYLKYTGTLTEVTNYLVYSHIESQPGINLYRSVVTFTPDSTGVAKKDYTFALTEGTLGELVLNATDEVDSTGVGVGFNFTLDYTVTDNDTGLTVDDLPEMIFSAGSSPKATVSVNSGDGVMGRQDCPTRAHLQKGWSVNFSISSPEYGKTFTIPWAIYPANPYSFDMDPCYGTIVVTNSVASSV